MTGDAFGLGAYLARIGHAGPRDPSLAVLRAVIARHTATIPFENIEVFATRGMPLDSLSLWWKMVRDGLFGVIAGPVSWRSFRCHCERSEAISRVHWYNISRSVLRFARNDCIGTERAEPSGAQPPHGTSAPCPFTYNA